MTTFALVHGAWLGGWSWDAVAPLLRQAGHQVVAVDLPAEDGAATFETYAEVVCAALGEATDDVIAVGHSYGGNTIPLVATRRPVRHLVYVAALVPEIGRSMVDQMRDDPEMLNPAHLRALSKPDDQLRRHWADLAAARELICHDCDDPTAAQTIGRLRPQCLRPGMLPSPLDAFPAVPATYVVCDADRFVGPGWSRRVARGRLGADIVELSSGHSPMLSQPRALADVLERIAAV
jgi:pimeloyl-ACP methyl ester carboxylesterase